MNPHDDPHAFIRDFYEQMTRDILRGVPDAEVIDRYHAPDVRQDVDGIVIDRDRLVAHVRPVRLGMGTEFRVEVHDALAAGRVLAARFTMHTEMRGRPVVTDVHLFGHFTEDGRLRRAHQLTKARRDGAA